MMPRYPKQTQSHGVNDN